MHEFECEFKSTINVNEIVIRLEIYKELMERF